MKVTPTFREPTAMMSLIGEFLSFDIKQDGRAYGRIWITTAGIVWRKASAKKDTVVPWAAVYDFFEGYKGAKIPRASQKIKKNP